jgi:hypothetical protein
LSASIALASIALAIIALASIALASIALASIALAPPEIGNKLGRLNLHAVQLLPKA